MAETKTNVMRLLDQRRIPYIPHQYPCPDGAVDGVSVAGLLGQDLNTVFKTLVTQAGSRTYYVFVIPVAHTLDLKAAARAVGEKSIEMIKQAQLLGLTGYVHGGCSPIGMKKTFPTVLDSSAQDLDRMVVSAGRIGMQVELAPDDLAALTGARFAPVSRPPAQAI